MTSGEARRSSALPQISDINPILSTFGRYLRLCKSKRGEDALEVHPLRLEKRNQPFQLPTATGKGRDETRWCTMPPGLEVKRETLDKDKKGTWRAEQRQKAH